MLRVIGLVCAIAIASAVSGCAGRDCYKCTKLLNENPALAQALSAPALELLGVVTKFGNADPIYNPHVSPVALSLGTTYAISGAEHAYLVRLRWADGRTRTLMVGRESHADANAAEFQMDYSVVSGVSIFLLHSGWVMGSDQWPRVDSPWVTISSVEVPPDGVASAPAAGGTFALHKQPGLFLAEKHRAYCVRAGQIPVRSNGLGDGSASLTVAGDFAYVVLSGPLSTPAPAGGVDLEILENMKSLARAAAFIP